jgi:hypothetical protein
MTTLVGSRHQALTIMPSVSTLLFACLPKCPLCLALLLAPLGVSLPHQSALLTATGAMLLVIPLGALYFIDRRKGGTGALWIGVIGVLLMGAGRFWAGSAVLVVVGSALMVAAFAWAACFSHPQSHCSHSRPLVEEVHNGQ